MPAKFGRRPFPRSSVILFTELQNDRKNDRTTERSHNVRLVVGGNKSWTIQFSRQQNIYKIFIINWNALSMDLLRAIYEFEMFVNWRQTRFLSGSQQLVKLIRLWGSYPK